MHFDRRLFAMTGWAPGIRSRIALATLFGILAVAASIGRLILTAIALYSVFQGEPFSSIIWYFPGIAGLIVLRSALEYLRDELADASAARMKVLIRQRLYDHVLTLGAGHFDQRRTGNAVNALVEGVERLEVFFGRYLPVFITAVMTPFLLFGAMVWFDFRTAMVFMTFALLALIAPNIFRRVNEQTSMERHRAYSSLNADFLDSMQGLPTLKIFGQSGRRGQHLATQIREVTRRTMHVLAVNIGITGVIMFSITAASAIALAWGAVRVEAGDLYFRTLLIVLMLGVEVFRPLQELSRIYHQGMMGHSAAKSVYELLDTPPAITDPEQPQRPDRISPEIRFENVTFGYGSGREPALVHCSFELRPGETLGVVGPSGAGKSTLVSLLMRFADPNDGRVLLGGYDLRELPLETIRRQISVVTQDAYLFDGSVADNIRLGKPDATQAEMEEAARLANAHDFICAMPHGYNTIVGERGTRLSGGQRQRIAIARALLKDAPILVLDEALSSVDAENEATIQQALEQLQKGRTTLTIAHRLSSVINADRIIVLERGRIVEEGTHPQLLRQNGVYAQLIATQRDAEAEEAQAGQIIDQRQSDDAVQESSTTGAARQAEPEPAIKPAPIPVPTLFWRLLKMVRPWPGELVAVIVSGLLHAITLVAVGVVGALLIGRVVTGGETGALIWILLALAPLTAICAWLDIWLAHDLAYRLLAELRIKLYNLLDRLSPAYMYRRRSGDLLGTATHDIELIELFYAHTIVPAMLSVLVPVGILIGLTIIHPGLALVLLPFLLAVALTPALARRRLDRLGEEMREHTAVVNSHTVDSVQGLRTIVAFDYGEQRQKEISKLGHRLADIKHHFLRHQSIQMTTVEGLTALGSLAVLALGAWFVSNGVLERTSLPLATLLALSAFGPVASIAIVAKELSETVAAARRYFAIEDEPVPVDDGPGVRDASTGGVPANTVEFDAVTFNYGPDEAPALSDVSFRVDTGQTIALVGSSGAGKSTIAHLLLRFWDPQEGRITIGGHDIRQFELDELRRQIGLVAQDTYLFRGTLFENLRMGNPDASDDDVIHAARQANVHEFAMMLPDGYDTQVGERGMQLSGGQRQRVAIARALLEDAPILILDEATSHLDAVNEMEVRQALETLRAGRTTLVIAHRLSTIRSADRILVLDQGRIVEEGTHNELVALDGFYSRLISAQIRGWSMREAPSYIPGEDD